MAELEIYKLNEGLGIQSQDGLLSVIVQKDDMREFTAWLNANGYGPDVKEQP